MAQDEPKVQPDKGENEAGDDENVNGEKAGKGRAADDIAAKNETHEPLADERRATGLFRGDDDPDRVLIPARQVELLRLPARSPNLNAYAERFVRTIRQECLGRMVFFGESSLRHAVAEFVIHYNQKRNHQGLAYQLIRPKATLFPPEGNLCRRKRLGGRLNHYYREAA